MYSSNQSGVYMFLQFIFIFCRLIAYEQKNNFSDGLDIDMAKLGGGKHQEDISHWNDKITKLFEETNKERQNKNKKPKAKSKGSKPKGQNGKEKKLQKKPSKINDTDDLPSVRIKWLNISE